MNHPLRLGVNIDHIATLRNARGGAHPCPVRGALLAQEAGADGITAHLREDRRHMRDADMVGIKNAITVPLNFEMAATAEMQKIALEVMPNAVCLVPEKREERTTEGGLDVAAHYQELLEYVLPLRDAGIRISMFIDPEINQIEASHAIGADIVELHTGAYAEHEAGSPLWEKELSNITAAATHAASLGLEVHAGHGLRTDNVGAIAGIPELVELNIGHFLMGEAMFVGLDAAIGAMRLAMNEAR